MVKRCIFVLSEAEIQTAIVHHKFKIMKVPDFTIEQIAAFHGVTVEAIKAQYLANIEGLERMHKKAIDTGKKVNGYTADQLKEAIALFKSKVA